MDGLRRNKYKDKRPCDTVGYLCSILEKKRIEMEETWIPENEIGTYSLRLNVKHTGIGSNGKGMSKEYARASAYAEFFERLENMKLQPNSLLYNVLRNNNYEFFLFPDEKVLSAEELIAEKNSFITYFLKERSIEPTDNEAAVLELQKVQKMDYNLLHEKNQFISIPYYSIQQDKVTYIPYFSENIHYGRNGMCAGNTSYEAIVQGLSEVVERMVQTILITQKVKLPDIPESYLKKFPEIYSMYNVIKNMEGYKVLLKDCSLGGKYPAAAFIIIEKNTGKYGVKVGCHPDYSIALERLFTEATQGIKLTEFSQKAVFDFTNNLVNTKYNLLNGFRTGDASYPYQLFSDKPDYEFAEMEDVSEYSNEELCKNMMQIFLEEGYDILIHDVSYLDFPAYHIIVPGVSEMSHGEHMLFEADNTRFHVQQMINQPKYITKENVSYAISLVNYFKHSITANTMKDLTGCLSDYQYPGKEVGLDHYYFLSMCYALQEKFIEARDTMHEINLSIWQRGLETNAWYLAIEYYFSAMSVLKEHKIVINYLSILFDESIHKKLDETFHDLSKI